jgi:hypothetical protein
LPAPAEPLRRLEEQVLPEADLIVETTGLHQIQHLIGRLAWEEGIPMVSCFLTNGFLAGEVLCLEQGKTMCVTCFQRNYGAKEVIRGDAAPEDQAAVSAQGCSHPTVVGAGFDAAEVSAMASRLAAQVLLKADSYPRPAWDHAVVNFQKSDQDHFLSEELTPTLGCRQCGAAG